MPALIRPVAKGLYLCDYVFGYENTKADLYGLFNSIRAESFPHTQDKFCVFAQLVNGLGNVPFFVDIRHLNEDRLVFTSQTRVLRFPNRFTVVQAVLEVRRCLFDKPGVYAVELYCDNVCVSDATVTLD